MSDVSFKTKINTTFIILCIFVLALSAGSLADVTQEALMASNEKLISINLKDSPIDSVIYMLAKEAGVNVISSDSIKGKITLTLKEIKPIEALAAVLRSSGCTYVVDGSILRITSIPRSAIDDIIKDNGVYTKTFVVNNVAAEDLKDTISKLDTKDLKILSIKDSNMIVVEGSAKALNKVSKLIKRMDSAPSQVLVESRIMEVTAGNGATPTVFGIKSKYSNSTMTAQTEGLANPATTGDPGFFAHVVKGNVDSYLQTLEHKEGYNLLANPKVIAMSGKSANIISGSKLGYKTTITTTTGTSQIVDFLEVGTKLTFTPFISSDGTIRMDIHPEVSEGTVNADGLPQKNTTEATTTVIVRDGETIIIGGLIKTKSTEVENGVPVIMGIPVLGNFFKKKEILWEKKEIIAMLTPHLITPKKLKEMAEEVKNMEQRQTDSNMGNPPSVWWWLK